MLDKKTLVIVFVSLGAVGLEAQLTTTFTFDPEFSGRYRELGTGLPRIDDNLVAFGDSIMGQGVRENTFSRSADASIYPMVNEFSLDYTLRTEASSTRFAVDWDFSSSADLTRPMGAGENFRANVQFLIRASVQIDAGTEYRMSWNAMGGDFIGDSNGLINSAYAAVQGDVVSPFTLGFGNSTPPTAPGDISFTSVATTDGTFDLVLESLFVNSASANQPVTSWDQFSRGSFVIEVIPTPSAAALLGVAGLAAARRRRA